MITLPEATRTEFEEYFKDNVEPYTAFYPGLHLDYFYALPLEMQIGVFTAYLRSKGIEAYSYPNNAHDWYKYTAKVLFERQSEYSERFQEPNTALAEAINAGLKLREQQLLTLTK